MGYRHAPTMNRSRPSVMGFQLRQVIESDLHAFFEHQREPEANGMAAFPAREKDAFLAHWANILADETVLVMAIAVDGNVAGNILSWEKDSKRLVGYWIGREYWGKGIATRALSEYLRLVKDRPLYAHVAKRNVASIRVLEKCGFTICDRETESLGEPPDGIEEFVFKLTTFGSSGDNS